MGLRAQLGWIRHGASQTNAAVAGYATELRQLQDKVEALTAVVARLDTRQAEAAKAELMIEAIKEQLRTITDDLGDRIGAVAEQLDSNGPTPAH